MTARCLCSVLAFTVVSMGAVDSGTPKTDDAKNILGNWKLVSLTKGGKEKDPDLKDARFKITATEIALLKDGKEAEPITYRINPSKKPKEIDLIQKVSRKGDDKEMETIMPGIYELVGDDLKICWTMDRLPKKDKEGNVKEGAKAVRPKDFKNEEAIILLLKRDK